jgi:transcriptional regulator with XRE-family HTH domain
MPGPKKLDPSSSPRALLGAELRHRREAAGLSQEELGTPLFVSGSFIGQLEAGTRRMQSDQAQKLDEVLSADGFFARNCVALKTSKYPDHFAEAAEAERLATAIKEYAPLLIPGLLQTEAYARAVLSAGRPNADRVDELVTARLERQRILTREAPPELWIVLDENVLRRRAGSAETMRAQLERLITASETPSNVIQIVPYDVGLHAGVAGPFAALTLDEGPDVVYIDGFLQGQILAERADVREAMRAYDLLTAVALSPARSIDMIAHALKELKS